MATTATTSRQSLGHVLADHEIRLTSSSAVGQQPSVSRVSVLPLPEIPRNADSPTDWPTDHRRVPPYRPINYNLDPTERIVYNNGGERAFITTMFFGLRLITVRETSRVAEEPDLFYTSPYPLASNKIKSKSNLILGGKSNVEVYRREI